MRPLFQKEKRVLPGVTFWNARFCNTVHIQSNVNVNYHLVGYTNVLHIIPRLHSEVGLCESFELTRIN